MGIKVLGMVKRGFTMRKKMMRNFLSRAMVVAVSASAVFGMSGCGESKENVTTQVATEATTEATTEKTTEATTKAAEATTEATTKAAEPAADASTEFDGGFTVDGTDLLDANGNTFVFRGINYPHSWYAGQDATSIPAIAETGSNSIRYVLGAGIQFTKDDAATVKKLIEQAKENNMIAILEVHDVTGKDDIASLEDVAQYWIEIKDALIGNEEYAILNIANEWIGTWEAKTWRDGYTQVIPELRAAGIKNTILVDSAGWGQYAKSIAQYGTEVFESDPDANTMFAIHMYGSAGGTQQKITSALKGVTDLGLCVCVGEFGYTHSDGDVDEEFIMQYCTDNNIGYLGWSWKGNSGGVEYLDIANEWDGSVLSHDWGENLINGEYGIKATSEICSIFTE